MTQARPPPPICPPIDYFLLFTLRINWMLWVMSKMPDTKAEGQRRLSPKGMCQYLTLRAVACCSSAGFGAAGPEGRGRKARFSGSSPFQGAVSHAWERKTHPNPMWGSINIEYVSARREVLPLTAVPLWVTGQGTGRSKPAVTPPKRPLL